MTSYIQIDIPINKGCIILLLDGKVYSANYLYIKAISDQLYQLSLYVTISKATHLVLPMTLKLQ